MTLTPGTGIDFTALATVLMMVAGAVRAGLARSAGCRRYVLNGVVQRTVYRLRERRRGEDQPAAAALLRLPCQRGELLSRVTNDIDNISQSLQQTISQAVTSVLTVVGVLVMMFVHLALLALIALVTVPLTIVTTAMIAKRSQKLFVAQWKHTGELNGQIEETYTGHALVKVFGRQREAEERFRQKNEELYESSFGAQFISGLIMPAMRFVGNLIYVSIAVVGGLQVASGAMQLGDVQAFIQYSRQFTQPLTQLALDGQPAAVRRRVGRAGVRAAGRRGAVPGSRRPCPPSGDRGRGWCSRTSPSRYSPDKPLIQDLSLVAEPGQTVAIVGPTGAGKTTLVNLLMRFYEIDGGRITLDGVDVTAMTRDELRSRMGMVLQDTWLFGGTIRDNIAYGRPGRHGGGDPRGGPGDVRRPVRAVAARRLRHRARRRGRQRLGRGEAAAHDRPGVPGPARRVLILDEATSSVDTRTEVLVQKAMSALRSDRTCFVIAHRLSTIRDADLILVMEAGRSWSRGRTPSCSPPAVRTRRCTRRSSRLRWRRFKFRGRNRRSLEELPPAFVILLLGEAAAKSAFRFDPSERMSATDVERNILRGGVVTLGARGLRRPGRREGGTVPELQGTAGL